MSAHHLARIWHRAWLLVMSAGLSGLAMWWLMPQPSLAVVPRTIHYQGKLTEPDGSPLVGEHTVTIRLYDAATGGAALWKEDHTIDLKRADNGVFSIVLGSLTPFHEKITFNAPLWLTTEVDGAGEFLPRQPLSAVGYAINADTLDGLDSTQLLAAAGAGDITAVIAGTGVAGGGSSGDVTLDVGAGTGIIVGFDAVSVDVGTTAGKIVQLDVEGALPAVSGANLTSLNAASLTTGTVANARLDPSVSLLGQSIESTEVTDGTLTAADTAATFLTAGSGVTISRSAASWQIDAAGAGGTITEVTAGAGLTGGGSSGAVTLDVGAGTGVVVAADTVGVNVGTGPNQIVQLDADGALPAMSGANLTTLNAANLASGAVPTARLDASVSLLGQTIESGEIADGTITAADAAATFLTAGTGVTIVKGATSWDISAVGSGGDITSVTAGAGLTGGATSGDATLDIGAGPGIAVNPDDLTIDATTSGTTATTSANSGLEVTAAGLRMLGGCGDGQLLKWNATTAVWSCAADTDTNSGGTVTSITAGAGLSGGTITTSGTISLSVPVSVADGGTGAATAASARTNLGAAASGANSDITSLSGLTTPLSVGQGGTGAAALTAGGLLLGHGTSPVTTTGVLAKGSLIVGDGATDPTLVPVGSNDAILMADPAQASGVKWATGCFPIGGADSAGRSSSFQLATFGNSGTDGRPDHLWPAPAAGKVTTLYAFVNQAPGTGDSWTVRFRKNDANATLTCTISGAATSCSTSGTETVAAGDRLGVEFTEGGTASSTLGSGWSACFVPN